MNVRKFAENLYSYANGPNAYLNNINIFEVSLTGNLRIQEMRQRKTKWIGRDDNIINPPKLPQDKGSFDIALPKQSIRSFYIEYIPFVG